MANWLIEKTIDLRVPKTSRVDDLEPAHALTVVGDDHGHTWRVTVQDGGQPAELTGNVRGYFIRADGATVMVTGTLSGNTATVELADACCAVEGPMVGLMRLESSSGAVTLAERRFLVRRGHTDTLVDPGHAFPSLEHVAGQYTELYNAYQSLSAQLQTAISSVTVDSEVQGVRAWASADMISETAGDAVRGQVDAVNAANAARSETLPAGYRRLAWIRSNGTQYINTGVAQKDITRLEISFVSHNSIGTSGYGAVFGARHYASSTQTDIIFLTTYSRTGKAILRYGADTEVDYDTEMAVKKPQVAVYDRESATFTVNGDTVQLAEATGWTYQHTMYLFCLNHSGSQAEHFGKVTCYGCDIWANGVLARHYVPALRLAAEGVTQLAGLYDTVNGVFYPDAAGGDFDWYGIEADAVQERLQAALDEEELHRRQVMYVDYGWEIGSVSATTGNELTSTSRVRTKYIPCAAGSTVISADGDATICALAYDAGKSYMPERSMSGWGTSFTMQRDGYLRIVARKANNADVTSIDEWAAKAAAHIIYPSWLEPGAGGANTLGQELHQLAETISYRSGTTFKGAFVMGVISDMHNSSSAWKDFAATVNAGGSDVDLALCLGDTTQDTSVDNYADPTDINGAYMYAVGNHDVGFSTSGGIDTAAVYDKFIDPLVEAGKIETDGNPYYYKDFPAYKIRVICLYEYEAAANTPTGDDYNYHYHRYITGTQLQWLADTLLDMDEGYGAIIVLHQIVWSAVGEEPIIDEASVFTVAQGYRETDDFVTGWGALANNVYGDCIGDVVAAFIAGGAISKTYSCKHDLASVSVTADFSNKAANTEFICYIGGHTHASYVVRLGDHPEQLQIIVPSGNPTSAHMREADDIRPDGSPNWYYIGINRARKVVKLLKVGTRLTCDCRERKVFETSYSAE